MTETAPKTKRPLYADKAELQRVMEEVNRKMGFVPDPEATPEKARQMMQALGIRPEDNLFSRGIIAAREGTDEEE